jgi:hypothetical protein
MASPLRDQFGNHILATGGAPGVGLTLVIGILPTIVKPANEL